MANTLHVVVSKSSKYRVDGFVERFRRGFLPNSTVPYVRSMTPDFVGDTRIEAHSVDEYVHTELSYMSLLKKQSGKRTLLALVEVRAVMFTSDF